ncbi:hypothetical protein PTE_03116 [Photorhabdus khanii NC19]|uniref:Uncharacterized protein n=1 Tax=Photorhabdus khanii NC19 TaxID=1004151 RepID=W3V5P7_9GAMM|nr:hypothetical protein PTE_03116 [Photorhabdus khanii NC19]
MAIDGASSVMHNGMTMGYYDSLATRYEGSQTDDSDGFEIT